MKILLMLLMSVISVQTFAGRVKGYSKKNFTYVDSYQRSNTNNTRRDNYSTKGNMNPFTGKKGTVKLKDTDY